MENEKRPQHSKTIVHIDIDYFYAQVEELKQPELQRKPIGVKQKNIVVTCNYVARSFGVKKCMLISDALKMCPDLLLFNGEDLYEYRHASNQIHQFLLSFTPKVEKSGFDENYLDITDLVADKEKTYDVTKAVVGHCLGDFSNFCSCGCHTRLKIGSQIAFEIRTKLKIDLGYTSCCGISYNKLLAKTCCSAHKPNQQTTLLPNATIEYLSGLGDVSKIPGIGEKTRLGLQSIGITSVRELQRADIKLLKNICKTEEAAVGLQNLSLGICDSEVKPSGKPSSIGLEDGCRKISVESEVREKFRALLQRLMILVAEDGRVPMTVKVTVRKHDSERKVGNKETKQSPIPMCLFGHPMEKLSKESADKLLNIIMGLFCKIVNPSRPFNVTLLGLAFTKFHEKASDRSIASFLLKKRDLSVQSLTSFVSKEGLVAPDVVIPRCSKSESDSEAEPSPKKPKMDLYLKKRKLEDDGDSCSPSKLRVDNLNLNGDPEMSYECPADVDPNVFKELPQEIREEIVRERRMAKAKAKPTRNKQTLIRGFCVPKSKNLAV